jgi:putative SOS response-associated peptidase YedK
MLAGDRAKIAEHFDVTVGLDLKPRYNIAPGQEIAVVRRPAASSARELAMLRWGLVPSWAKDPSIGFKTINARAETIASKPAFREAIQHRRCLIPATGFYEWRREGKTRTPFCLRHARRRNLCAGRHLGELARPCRADAGDGLDLNDFAQ